MSDPRLELEKRRHIAFKTKLLADDPALDERTLADTLEGLTDLKEMLAATVRAVIKDEADVETLGVMLSEMNERRGRLQARADRRRVMVRDAMNDAGMLKLTLPDFTASVRPAQPALVVIDEKLIPQTFIEMRPHLRKRELLDALKGGVELAGVALSNPAMTLSVRTK